MSKDNNSNSCCITSKHSFHPHPRGLVTRSRVTVAKDPAVISPRMVHVRNININFVGSMFHPTIPTRNVAVKRLGHALFMGRNITPVNAIGRESTFIFPI